jgi:hypothetical protein
MEPAKRSGVLAAKPAPHFDALRKFRSQLRSAPTTPTVGTLRLWLGLIISARPTSRDQVAAVYIQEELIITEDDVRKISNGLAQDNGGNLFLNT